MTTAKKTPSKSATKSAAAPPDSAAAALALLTPRLLQIEASAVLQPRNDVRTAASFVLAEIVPKITAAGLNQRLRDLPAAEFDYSAVDDLQPAALACMASQAQLASSTAQTVTVRLPTDLLDEATTVKTRMLKVCTHQFEDHELLGPEVADIRAGSGYMDLAQDLIRLSAIYKDEAPTVALDGRYYDKKDGPRASALADRITGEMRHSESENSARDLAWRAYTFLDERYEEVASTCRWLERKSDGEKHFPSLRAATGQGRKRSRTKDAAAPTSAPAEEQEQPGANG